MPPGERRSESFLAQRDLENPRTVVTVKTSFLSLHAVRNLTDARPSLASGQSREGPGCEPRQDRGKHFMKRRIHCSSLGQPTQERAGCFSGWVRAFGVHNSRHDSVPVSTQVALTGLKTGDALWTGISVLVLGYTQRTLSPLPAPALHTKEKGCEFSAPPTAQNAPVRRQKSIAFC